MEHPSELLLDSEKTKERLALFGLVFEQLPTFDELSDAVAGLDNGTPKLTWVFEVSSASGDGKSNLVRLERLRWNTIESTIRRWDEVFVLHRFPFDEQLGGR